MVLNSKTNKVIEQKRRHKREKCHCSGSIYDRQNKSKIICATFDISVGGTRIVTDSVLAKKEYEVVIGKKKLLGTIVHVEERHSSMMEKQSYYYGIQFKKPISPAELKTIKSGCDGGF